jgi:ComF family protein
MRISGLVESLLELSYPGACSVCGAWCQGRLPLCVECLANLQGLESASGCTGCGQPLPRVDAPCQRCQGRGLRPLERLLRLGTFADPLRRMIHQIKYHGQWPLGEHLADRLLEQEAVKRLLTDTDCLVAVPLYPMRHIMRGYNQAEVIARRLSARCRIPSAHPVERVRNTETQTHLHSRAKRLANLKDAFELVDAHSVRGRHVVLVDDVLTSGATLQEVARTLKAARPASICAIVIAVADPKGQDFKML